mgnify:CR=1 FL=1
MRPLRWRCLGAAATILLSTAAMAGPVAHVAAWDTLYRLDLGTRQATAVGTGLGYNDVEGLAMSPDGAIYGVADGTAGSGSLLTDFLLRINPETGDSQLVGALSGLAGLGVTGDATGQLDYGLAFTCDGRLWMSSDTLGLLWEVDPSTGAVQEVFDMHAPISGLAGRGNKLYGIGVELGFGNRNDQALYEIDPDARSVRRIGSLGINETFSSAGADFDADGVLWTTLDSQPPYVNRPSLLARVDLQTGRANVTGSIAGVEDNISVRAMAIAPPPCPSGTPVETPEVAIVPGPGLPWLLSLAGLALWAGRRRMRVS